VTQDRNETRPARSDTKTRSLTLARAALFWEKAWPAAWPALGIAGLFLVLALTDLLPLLPGWLHLLVLAGFAAGLAWSLYRFAQALALPSASAAARRIERDSGFRHRPLAALGDELAVGGGDAFSEALWRAHLERMRAQLGRMRITLPRAGLAARDPRALRLLLIVVLALGFVAAGSDAPHRLARALLPQLGPFATRPAATVELWLTPPTYTGLAPIFLRAPTAAQETAAREKTAPPPAPATVNVPVGSKLLGRVQGGSGVPQLHLADKTIPFKSVDESTYQLENQPMSGDRLEVRQGGRTIGAWAIRMVPETAPTIAFATPPAATQRAALRLEYTAADQYGLAKVKAEIRRVNAPKGEQPIELDLPLSNGHPKQAHETSFHDLTPHPWAGLPVTIQLFAKDEAGKTGKSDAVETVLPERTFHNPVARAIIAERKELTADPAKRFEVSAGLTAIASQPGLFHGDIPVFLALIAARARLQLSDTPATIASVQKLLWDTALAVEEGHLPLAERELRDLQKKLQDALDRNAPDSEIQDLISQLENAIDRYLAAMIQQQMQNPEQNQPPLDQNAQQLRMQDLHKLLDQMREMARTGARDAARQLLSQLQDMLENLRIARGNPNGQAQNGAGELMRNLDRLIGRQDDLLQRTFREAQQGRDGPPMAPPGQGRGAAEQEALRRALGEIMRRFGEMTGQIPDPLGRAEQDMGQATGALNRDAPGEAADAQSQALDQLRQGREAMMQQLRNQFGQQNPNMFDPFGPSRDPLGRVTPGYGNYDANDVRIPDHGAMQRAREIEEELQRRAGERQRPEIELEYIDRLLKRF